MAIFTFTFIVLGAILRILFYLIAGICQAVFYIVGFTFMGLRDLYRSYQARKERVY